MSGVSERQIALAELIWDTDTIQPGKVVAIAASFRATSHQINAIQVRPHGKNKFRVVAGRHRCEAAKSEGWKRIRATVLPYATKTDRLHAELIEIDENLCRNNLSEAAESALMARRKAVYEQLHPETTHGGKRPAKAEGASRQIGDLNDRKRFSELTAQATGKSERSVQRTAQRGQALGVETLQKLVGTSLDKGVELDALIALAPEKRTEVVKRAVAGEKVSAKVFAAKERRADREKELGQKQQALPQKKYGAMLADPEWDRDVRSRETGMSRHAANHYPVSSDEVIASRPVASIAADDCVLGLWCTDPHRGVDLMRAWGFEPKSYFVWVKGIEELEVSVHAGPSWRSLIGKRILVVRQPPGTGYWNRDRDELLLIGTRGSPVCPAMGEQGESVWFALRGEHSEKPACSFEWFEKHFANTPKIELNARGPGRPGWDVWGNEAITETESGTVPPPVRGRSPGAKPAAKPARDADETSAEGMNGAPGVAAAPTKLDGAANFLPPPKVAGMRAPSGKSVPELIASGDIVRFKSGRGPFAVQAVVGAKPSRHTAGIATFALLLVDASAQARGGRLKPSSWISDLVGVDGRVLKLFETDDEEVFVEKPPAEQPEPPKPAAPVSEPPRGEIDTTIPPFLKREPPKRAAAERRT
jgi:N6-adenosine-specific RNA methylase IME4